MNRLTAFLFWKTPFVRDAAATARGFQIQKHRYGSFYTKAIQEIEERDTWSPAQLQDYQNSKIRELIHTAALHVPYYRNIFQQRGLKPDDIQGIQDLPKLPVLEKNELRKNPEQFLDERLDRTKMIKERTTGTTGTPVWIYKPHEALQTFYAYFEARCRRIAGMKFGIEPYAMIGAAASPPVEYTKPPFWCYNYKSKQLYMSAYHLSPSLLGYYCDELTRRPYTAFMGYPSSLYAVAHYALENNRGPFHFKTAITSGEALHDHQRETIEKAFNIKVYDQYGCSENCIFAAECPDGQMHISTDYAAVEVVDNNGIPVENGENGEFVCTGLINQAQILIRYRVGDRGAIDPAPCSCGRNVPILKALDGRDACSLYSRDGRRIGRLSRPLMGVTHAKGYQVIQEDFGKFKVLIAAVPGFSDEDKEKIRQNITIDVGEGTIDIIPVNEIEPGPGGKILLTKCEIPKETLQQYAKGV